TRRARGLKINLTIFTFCKDSTSREQKQNSGNLSFPPVMPRSFTRVSHSDTGKKCKYLWEQG
ncbi:MAG: hypothetical protein ACLUIG_12225, partial [Barnesiella intestinihominis]